MRSLQTVGLACLIFGNLVVAQTPSFSISNNAHDTLFLVDSTGKVGVGTTQPEECFTVKGVIQSDSGGFRFPDGSLQTSAATASASVPIGTVLDWWRPNDSFGVPKGYRICDGSTIEDAQSPLNGQSLPDLRNRFVIGASTADDIGETGGDSTHSHTASTATAGKHDHGGRTAAVSSTMRIPNGGQNLVASYDHMHAIYADGSHTHAVTIDSANHLPPYVGLLKIMRIK